jgi:hypothetical protein
MKNRHTLKTLGFSLVGIAAALLVGGQVLAQTYYDTGGRLVGPQQEPDGFVPVWQQQQQAEQKAKQDAAKAKQDSDSGQKKAKGKSAQ